MNKKILSIILLFCMTAGVSFIQGCSGSGQSIEYTNEAIEKVATDMLKIGIKKGYKTPFSPQKQVEVVRESFKKNGYSMEATLHKFAEEGFNPLGIEMQVIGLLLIPSQELSEKDLAPLYSKQELTDLEKIKKMLNNL